MRVQQEYLLVYIPGRANLKTLILYQEESALEKTDKIENYYGFEEGITGKKLYETGIKQAKNLGIEVRQEEIINIELYENDFRIFTLQREYMAKAVIFATGNKKKKPNIQGLNKFEGRGVSYCAVCDGFFYKNKNVAVIGNGNYAVSEVNDLLPIASHITILSNGEQAPELRAENVEIDTRIIEQIHGENKVEEIQFSEGTNLRVDGVFVAQGVASSFDFARKLGVFTR